MFKSAFSGIKYSLPGSSYGEIKKKLLKIIKKDVEDYDYNQMMKILNEKYYIGPDATQLLKEVTSPKNHLLFLRKNSKSKSKSKKPDIL